VVWSTANRDPSGILNSVQPGNSASIAIPNVVEYGSSQKKCHTDID
jgi:hypothetical protein